MNWLTAHRIAGIAATHLYLDLGLAEGDYVDIISAFKSIDLVVMGQPMPRLFGVYLPATDHAVGGILLNSGLDETTIRHTAAHEWGHHVMGHTRCFGEGLDPMVGAAPAVWTSEEKQAEAFAAWLLMPIKAVRRALARLGTNRPRSAADAYQLSLQLGTSYRGTVRHLSHLRMIPPDVARGWAGVPPARLRQQISPDREGPARVWDLGAAMDGCRLPVQLGDQLVIRGAWIGSPPDYVVPDALDVICTGDALQVDVAAPLQTDAVVTVKSAVDGSTWAVSLAPTPGSRRGLLSGDRRPAQTYRNPQRTRP